MSYPTWRSRFCGHRRHLRNLYRLQGPGRRRRTSVWSSLPLVQWSSTVDHMHTLFHFTTHFVHKHIHLVFTTNIHFKHKQIHLVWPQTSILYTKICSLFDHEHSFHTQTHPFNLNTNIHYISITSSNIQSITKIKSMIKDQRFNQCQDKSII